MWRYFIYFYILNNKNHKREKIYLKSIFSDSVCVYTGDTPYSQVTRLEERETERERTMPFYNPETAPHNRHLGRPGGGNPHNLKKVKIIIFIF